MRLRRGGREFGVRMVATAWPPETWPTPAEVLERRARQHQATERIAWELYLYWE